MLGDFGTFAMKPNGELQLVHFQTLNNDYVPNRLAIHRHNMKNEAVA